jgi:hypothetical protein
MSCALLLLLFASAALAEPEQDSGFTMSVQEVRMLTIDRQSILLNPDIHEIINGMAEPEKLSMAVSANVAWVLTVRGTDPYWNGPWEKPVTDILWRVGQDEFKPLTTDPVEVMSGNPTTQKIFDIDLTSMLSMEKDVPGDYSYAYIVFELTPP